MLVKIAHSSPSPEESARAHIQLTDARRFAGAEAEAIQHATTAQRIAEEAGLFSLASEARNALGGVTLQQHRLEDAEAVFRAILMDPDASAAVRGLAVSNLGMIAAESGDLERAARLFTAAHGICRDNGHRKGEITALHNLGRVNLDLGDLDAAVAYFDRTRQEALHEGITELSSLAQMNNALALTKGGNYDPERSAYLLGQAVGEFVASDNRWRRGYSLGVHATICEENGDLETARRSYQAGIADAVQYGFAHLLRWYTEELARLGTAH